MPVGEINPVTVYDIAPTILYLSGLPVGKDMDGNPIAEAIDPRFQQKYPVQYIESYDQPPPASTDPVRSVLDKDIIERYKSLGYIQ